MTSPRLQGLTICSRAANDCAHEERKRSSIKLSNDSVHEIVHVLCWELRLFLLSSAFPLLFCK